MPVYDYRCEKGHRFEVVQSMSDKPIKKCEECGAPSQRVLHAPAIHFKGSGFHNTDYGTKKRPKEQPAAAPSGGTGGSGNAGNSGTSGGSSGGSEGGKSSGKTVGLDTV